MNFTQFYEILLQQEFFNFNRPNGPEYANTEKAGLDRLVMANNAYNDNFSVKTRLEHGFAIEYTHFQ